MDKVAFYIPNFVGLILTISKSILCYKRIRQYRFLNNVCEIISVFQVIQIIFEENINMIKCDLLHNSYTWWISNMNCHIQDRFFWLRQATYKTQIWLMNCSNINQAFFRLIQCINTWTQYYAMRNFEILQDWKNK